jgi:predicted acylesterase/phospholipase RssA
MLAGTSAGAMTGTVYASGFDPEYATQCFKNDLLPPWFFRKLPAGGYWYLLYKYRCNKFDPMLRKYLDDLHMEQLVIPMITIAVDLVEGIPLMRDTGDATLNILESINLPPLSLPIVRSERALVDGGLLNNVPANVLVAKGCNFVIASTVAAQLEKDFMGIRSKRTRGASRFFSTIQVVMRQNMIQGHSMNAVGVAPADFVIAPDVTSFDMSAFTRAEEMAVVGERTTNDSIDRLRRMLAKLDPELFASHRLQIS